MLGASPDGTYVYYQDGAGIKQWYVNQAEVETTTVVAAGENAAVPSDYPPDIGTSRVSADGQHLAFLSSTELNGHDNLDANSGLSDTELYVYGPPPGGGPATLFCASCNPTGERPQGSSTIPGAPANGSTQAYKPRALSTDGARVFFDSRDKLVLGDTNSRADVYEWEAPGAGTCNTAAGCVGLISSGRSSEDSSFLDASADGSDAYFITGQSLVDSDPGSIDVYDAKVGGGFTEALKPIACIGDACQALPSAPEDPTPGTLVPTTGNPPLKIVRERPKHHKHKKRRRKHHHGRRR